MNTNQQVVRFFWQQAWHYKALVISLIIAVIFAVPLLQFLPPLVIADILDRLSTGDYQPGDLWGSFGREFLIFIALSIAGGVILWRIAVILVWQLEMRVVRDIYQKVFNHLIEQSATFHANRFGGSLVSQTNKLAGAYVRMADTTIFQLSGLVLSFIFAAIILAPRVPAIAIGLIIFSIIFIVSAVKITKRVRTLNAEEAALQNKQTGALADAVTNIMAVKGLRQARTNAAVTQRRPK